MMLVIRSCRSEILVGACLMATTLVVFRPACVNDFVNYDDNRYVTRNPCLGKGLTLDGIAWAFTTFDGSNWHPLTWLCYLVEHQLGGLDPRVYHTTSVLVHAANVWLLFLALRFLTGVLWRSALVAALFAFHPLHVESVAWVSEQKDVLSTFFALLTLLAYTWYSTKPHWGSYLLVVVCFGLGLMAKPMLVTLPCVLLLLDYWPLKRTEPIRRLLWEKAPLFVLSAGSCILNWYAQQHWHSIQSLERYSLEVRLENAIVAYARYITQLLWRDRLAAFYPHPGNHLSWQLLLLALLVLIGITVLVLRLAQRHPYLLVGWLWYLGTLVPVIGLVQTGHQGWADRYTYVPIIGLFVMMAWGLGELAERWDCGKYLTPVACAALVLCALASGRQISYWRNDLTLWRHAVEVTSENALAHYNLGNALIRQGQVEEAARHFADAIRIDPANADAHNNLGIALRKQGKLDDAIAEFRMAVALKPNFPDAHTSLCESLGEQGQVDEAIAECRLAIELEPTLAVAHNSLGAYLAQQGRWEEGIAEFRQAIELQPDLAEANCNLGQALRDTGKFDKALIYLKRGHELGSRLPGWPYPSAQWIRECERLVQLNARLSRVLAGKEAVADARERISLAKICYQQRRFELATRFYEQALAQEPALAQDLTAGHRYQAACNAALAGLGEGQDSALLGEQQRAGRRQQALDWLRADLQQWSSALENPSRNDRATTVWWLKHWLQDPSLKGLRDDDSLAKLAPEERQACANLWKDVRNLLARAQGK